MRKKEFVSLLKTAFTALAILPLSLVMTPFIRRKHINSHDFFCLGVDFERYPQETLEMVKELGV